MVKNIGNIRTRKIFKSQQIRKIKKVIIKKIRLTSKKIVEKTAVTDVNRKMLNINNMTDNQTSATSTVWSICKLISQKYFPEECWATFEGQDSWVEFLMKIVNQQDLKDNSKIIDSFKNGGWYQDKYRELL